jgi:hypothetical protein
MASSVLAFAFTPAVEAEEPSRTHSIQAHGAVEVRIGAVIASNSGRDFDPRLVALRQQFDALFPYSSYQLLKEERQRVAWGAKAGFDIPGVDAT